ncbi:MAG: ATP-dependent RNA helicase HrpA [Phycisphaerales bacterium]|nr:ATP-dependent RNA helicase HrpA [Phycisphaerales bacterium]
MREPALSGCAFSLLHSCFSTASQTTRFLSLYPPPLPDLLATFSARLDRCMLPDAYRFARTLRQIERDARRSRKTDHQLAQLTRQIDDSIARREFRQRNLPTPTYPADLPVSAMREEIKAAILQHQVIVLCGETGSGKTTQLPKICLELGRGVAGLIGHTQPRRIAARSVATRIAQELEGEVGRAVGYKVRFGDRTSADTYIKLMTDGILLAETQTDRLLTNYDTIIIDEAHERSLNIDFLLGYLRQILPRRPDLKVIVTSATIDPQRFSNHFARHLDGKPIPAPIVMVPGRTYPVDLVYMPPLTGDEDHESALDMETAILHAVDEAATRGPGDVLVFLPGEREIRESAEALRKHHPPNIEILPLYARLSPDEQMRVFDKHAAHKRRIVLATNVAETSLTVPGIRYVVDTGMARIKQYNPRTKVTRLPVEAISRASADQRKGRAGRLGPGVCFRLYTEEDFRQRDEFTTPEILRTNLASVILQMTALKLGRIEEFPFVEAPDGRAIRSGYDALIELGALDELENLTPMGEHMARLPIDPTLARMLLAADKEGSLAELLIIASALSAQDPRDRPMEHADAADQAHRKFLDPHSDFITLLNIWSWYQENKKHLSHAKLRKLTRTTFISFLRMREWEEVHRQLHELMSEMGFHSKPFKGPWSGRFGHEDPDLSGNPHKAPNHASPSKKEALEAAAEHAPIHRAVLAGLLGGVAKKNEETTYTGPRGGQFTLWPGSTLFRKGPRWIVAAELVQTSRLFARTIAKVQPEWIEEVGAHLIKRTHSDPHWDREHGTVYAYERITLWGLELIARRRIHYGPIEPKHSRDVFIHHALVEAEAEHHGPFFTHNQQLLEQASLAEAKARKHGLLADSQARFAFYDRRIPANIFSMAAFEKWRRLAERDNPRLLYMTLADALVENDPRITPDAYPDALPLPAPTGSKLNLSLPIQYKYDPGAADDGITLDVPLQSIGGLDPARCEWLVPGMLHEKIIALVRLLPKGLRNPIENAPAFADECLKSLAFGTRPLAEVLSEQLGRKIGAVVPQDAWKFDELPTHLRMNVRVFDEQRKLIAAGRDPDSLKLQLTPLAAERFAEFAKDRFDRDGLKDWDFGDLPDHIQIDRFGVRLTGYPGIIDRGQSVDLRLLQSHALAQHHTRAGLRRLYWLALKGEMRSVIKALPTIDSMAIRYAPSGPPAEFKEQLELLIAERACMPDPWLIRTRAEFDRRLAQGSHNLYRTASQVASEVAEILDQMHQASLALSGKKLPQWADIIADAKLHLALLSDKGFLTSTPREWFGHLPRFFRGIHTRLTKLTSGSLDRDQRAMTEMRPLWLGYLTRAKHNHDHNIHEPALEEHRWLLEELRISLFAQELRTSVTVSIKRLYEHWERTVLPSTAANAAADVISNPPALRR